MSSIIESKDRVDWPKVPINFSMISKRITGKEGIIRKNSPRPKYDRLIQDLNKAIEGVIRKYE